MPLLLNNWKDNCNNPVTQRCPYVNSLALFTPPAFLTIGNTPRVLDYLRGPHQTKYNMAILKDFPIHEQIRLAFRAETVRRVESCLLSAPTGITSRSIQNLDYSKGGVPTVTSANIDPAYSDMGISGNRTMQLGLKLYF